MKNYYQNMLLPLMSFAALLFGVAMFGQEGASAAVTGNLLVLPVVLLLLTTLFVFRPVQFIKKQLQKLQRVYPVTDSISRTLTAGAFAVCLTVLFSGSLNAQITGQVFRDYNGDGVKQAGEPTREGIIVKAYADGVLPVKDAFLVQATTDVNGNYSLTPPSYPVRLEYIIPSGLCNLDPSQDFPAPLANTYGSSIQFASGPGVHNFVINYPSDFSIDPNPQVFTSCFVNGDPLPPGNSGDADAFVRFNYLDNGHGSNSTYPNPGPGGGPYADPHDLAGVARQVGTVWGLAYSRQAKKVFTSAFLKRHAGMGPLGPGGIYLVDANNFSPAADYRWLNFDVDLHIATHDNTGAFTPNPMVGPNTVSFEPTVGSNAARGLSSNKFDPSRDAAAWEQVGKVSFGDCDVSEDGRYLYVVNLYDRKLYSIDLQNPYAPVKPLLADVGTKVLGFNIPNPCGAIPGAGEYRPFACKFARGKVYVGVICSGQAQSGQTVGNADDMYAYVYEFDAATNTFNPTPVLQYPLNYRASTANSWQPWTPTFQTCFECQGYPMLADIEFDGEGNMILGMMDRRGHEAGWYQYDLEGSGSYAIAAVGDILRAVRNKNVADCQYSISFNPEFYKDDKYHAEPTQGGLAVHRTSDYDNILCAYMDPVWIWSGGVMRFDNKTGNQIGDGYEIYYNTNGGNTGPFGKAHGIGDLEVVEEEPPIEIGNRIWFDTDGDGIQDGGEIGAAGVTVQLRANDGVTVLGTTVTAADGSYYFFLNNVADGDPVTPGNQPGVQPFTNYKIYVPATQFATGGPLKNALLTIANQTGAGSTDLSDSDGMQSGSDVVIMFTTTARGENNHTLDIGFIPADYGDLPNSYTTSNASNGPWHTITSQLKLGSCVDGEPEGAATSMATGDDSTPAAGTPTVPQSSYPCDDEDGVVFSTPMIPGSQACVTVNVMNSTGANATLQAWIDFNGDGQFQPGEQLTTADFAPTGKVVPNGGLTNAKLCFDVPATATFQGGMAMVRFRLSPAGGLTPSGPGGLGEVEDYKVPLAKVGTLVWNDFNNDGIQNEAANAGINGMTVNLTWLGPDGVVGGGDDVNYTTTTSFMNATDGSYMFIGLTPGMYKLAPVALPGYINGREDIGGNDVKDGDAHAGVMVVINDPISLPTGENGTGDNPGGTNGFPDAQDNLTFDFNYIAVDYGDLPITYGTTDNTNGPKHVVNPNLKLGAASDGDPDGQPDSMAGAMTGGDDNDADGDDEDGVTVSGPMIPGTQACFIVNAMNMTGAAAVLQAWIDFNGDGQFQPTEQLTTGAFAPTGAAVPNGGLTNAKLCFDIPANATFLGGQAMMRFRLSPTGGLLATGIGANGLIPSGEVEDYKVTLAKVGTYVWNDYNFDGQQNEPATAGLNGVGVRLTWLGADGVVGGGDDVIFTTTTSTMNAAEGQYMFLGLTSGMYKLSVPTIPASFAPTTLNTGSDVTDADDPAGVMVQIPNPVALPTGENGTGDVPGGTNGFPDNQDDLTYDFGYVQRDYGDLPNTYTTINPNGPSHVVNPGLTLGTCIDAETNGQPDAMAGAMTGGDDNTTGANVDGGASTCGDDEDGITFVTPLIPGASSCVRVNAVNTTGADAKLQGWIDFNGNGTFEANEQLSTGSFAVSGANVPVGGLSSALLCFDVPQAATFQGGVAMVRFRLSVAGGLTPTGADGPGEVEDYKVSLAKIGNLVWTDYNNDGQQNEPVSAGINGAVVVLTYAGADGDISTTGDNISYTTTTSTMNATPGIYMFYGLISGAYKVSIPTPPNGAIPTKLNIGNDVTDSDNAAGEMVMIPAPIGLPTGENGTGDNPGGTNGFPDAQDNLTIDFGYVGFDYGDLPNSYSTSTSTEGPKHVVTPDLYLGACVDSEEDAFPDAMAGLMGGGDDGNAGTGTQGTCAVAGDDENGIIFETPLIPGWQACIRATVKNTTGQPAKLQAWIDFNGNGSFDAGEELNSGDFTPAGGANVPVAGLNNAQLCFNIPLTATFQGGQAMVRFRLSPNGGLLFNNPANTIPTLGEVEDYKVTLAKVGNFVWWDYDYDGQQDPNEPGINNAAVKLTWLGPNGVLGGGDDREYTTLTSIMNSVSGMYMFQGLTPGMYKLAVTNTPVGFTPTRLNQGSDVTDADDPTGVMVSIPNPVNLITGENGTGDVPGGTNGFPDTQDDLTYDFGYIAIDYGDLPNGYGTTNNQGGPRHRVSPTLFMGTCADGEVDGQPGTLGNIDDLVVTEAVAGACANGDDENGIVKFETPMIPGYVACIRATAVNNTGDNAVMQVWIDFNGNGTLEAGEQLLTGNFAPAGAIVPNGGVANQLYCFDVPPTATFTGGNAIVRVRLSPLGGLGPNGPNTPNGDIPTGEVEDYVLPLAKIGNLVWNDWDNNGQQNEVPAAGLNNVQVNLVWAGSDLSFGTPDDRLYTTTTANMGVNGQYMFLGLIPGPYKVSLPTLPANFIQTQLNQGSDVSDADDAAGQMVMVPDPIVLPTGENATGDVPNDPNFPDPQNDLTIDFGLITRDFGDLPDTYGTTDGSANDGPVHVVNPNLNLGACADGEMDGNPEPMAGLMAGGDDNTGGANVNGTASTCGDDENGIVFETPMVPGTQACVRVNAINTLQAPAVLQMWIDYNGNGTFDVGEQVNTGSFAPNGATVPPGGLTNAQLCFNVPNTATFADGSARVRVRISPAGGLTPNGPENMPFPVGEVEDYKVPVAKVGSYVWNDNNNDGIQNEPGTNGLNNILVQLVWAGPDGNFATTGDNRTYTTTTAAMNGVNGQYMFWGLTSGAYKLSVPTNPAGFIPTQLNIGSDVTDADDPAGIMVMIPNPINLPVNENGTGDQPGGFNNYPDNQDDLTYDFGYVSVDYGDLPNTYVTTIASGGPKHIVNPNLKLGASVDGELDGQPEAMAGMNTGGDDGSNGLYNEGGAGDDENGVTFLTPMIPGFEACIRVNTMNTLGGSAVLQGWVDWNGDGDVSDAGEELNTGSFAAAANGAIVPAGASVNSDFCFTVPATATFQGGAAYTRFRLSPTGGLTPSGPAVMPYPIGEVEDHKVLLAKAGNLVWIDANVDGLQTQPLEIPLGIDGVTVQLQWAGPDGNFNTVIDNRTYTDVTSTENGVKGKYLFCGMIPGNYKVVVPPFGYVPTLIIDINGNTQDVIDSDNPAGVTFTVPNPPTTLPTGENGIGDSPLVINGFPDNQANFTFDFGYLGFDFGDLPDTYGTTQGAGNPGPDGAVHTVTPDLYLGPCVDIDIEGQPEAMAGFMTGGDDGNAGPGALGTCTPLADDENGISFPTPLIPGNQACVKVTARNNTGGSAFLQAWMDLNGDGAFQANEQITTGDFAPAGATIPNGGVTAQNFCFTVPANATFTGGNLFARFRLSKTGGVGPTGPAIPGNGVFPNGEVEDYKLPLALIGSYVWMDNPDIEGDQDATEMALANVKLNLIWPGEDGIYQTAANSSVAAGDDRVYMVTTDANGKYEFRGLIPSTNYRILAEKYTAPNGVAGALINPLKKILTIPNLPSNDNLDSDGTPLINITIPNLTTVLLPTGENGIQDNNGGNGFPDNQENLSFDLGFIDEPNIDAALAIVGFDPTVCGEFAAYMDLCIKNTSTAPLASIQAVLDLAGANAFGASFKGMIGTASVVSSTAQQNPVFNTGYTGVATGTNANLFNGTSGLLWPGEQVCIRIKFGVDPDIAGAPANPKGQAVVTAKAQNFQAVPIPDYWNGGQQYVATDLSDAGTDAMTTNPGAIGDTGSADDPTPLGDCWQSSQPLACNDNVQVSMDEVDCETYITADMLLEGEDDDCTEVQYPLGSFWDVIITGANNQPVPNPVPASYLGQTLKYKVQHIMTCNSCWGTFKLEDKLAPQIACQEIVLNCAVENYSAAYLSNTLNIAAAYPQVTDCSAFTLTYDDTWHDLNCNEGFNGHADLSAYVTRNWRAVDAYGNVSNCTQYIYFNRIHVGDVQLPADVTVSCSAQNTAPSATGAPFVTALGHNWTLSPSVVYCETSVTYTDDIIPVCDGTYKIERTWRIHDWCQPTSQVAPFNPRYVIQIITVMDNQGPVIACPGNVTVSTDPFTCCSTTDLPDVIITDGCSRVDHIFAKIVIFDQYTGDTVNVVSADGSLVNFAGNNLWDRDTMGAYGLTPCLPIGTHHVYYYATDNCGNHAQCSFDLTVADLTPPVAACDEWTQVALGVNGAAFVNAATFDDGSYDNCGGVFFKVRRMDTNTCDPNTEFEDQVKFCCSDINDTITVILRVYDVNPGVGVVGLEDFEGHYNECMVQALVEDKIKPTCTAPANVTVSCESFDPSYWAYGQATATDNCCIDTITATVVLTQFDSLCNKGTITRRWTAIDCGGNTSQCSQRIIVTYTQNYYVKFPADKLISTCDGTGTYGAPEFYGEDCELLATSFVDEIFTVVPDACFKIERTWTVINWCTYNPNAGCTYVPNPNPSNTANAPANLAGVTVSAPGTTVLNWNPTVVKINSTDPTATNFSTFWSAGANCYQYKQIIKIYDTQDPTVVTPTAAEYCDLSANDAQFWNNGYWWDNTIASHDLCEGDADIAVTATDACSGANISFRYLLFLDLDGDGTMETVVNSVNPPGFNNVQFNNANNPNYGGGEARQFDFRPVPANQKWGFGLQTDAAVGNNRSAHVRWFNQQGQNAVPQLPYGNHKIKWFIEDGCGNEFISEQAIVVKDCKKPTVVCINGLAVNLMNIQGGMVQVWASDFLQYTQDNCTPADQLKIGIRRSGTGTGFPTNPDGTAQTGVSFTCADLGTQLVELWSIDKAGNADFCETYILIQDNAGVCGNNATIAGSIATELAEGVQDATVELEGMTNGLPMFNTVFSQVTGNYAFSSALPFGSDYTVTPTMELDPLNGVNTYDLILISRHILGLEPLNSPYKLISADANKSGTVTTFDVVELRKLILGTYTELPNNSSWRFIDKTQTFADANNPFAETIRENVSVAQIQQSAMGDDFVGAKIGDVDNTATPNNLVSVDDRTNGTLLFDTDDRDVRAGETFSVTLTADQVVKGYQFTMNLKGLKVTAVEGGTAVTDENFGIFSDAATTSWDAPVTMNGKASFTLRMKATESGRLSQMLSVSSRITKAEAYTGIAKYDVGLRFNGKGTSTITGVGFELYQNVPNPWITKTTIGFHLPEAATATLTVFDGAGRTLLTQKGDFAKGYNTFLIDRKLVDGATNLYYKVSTTTDSGTKQMIQVR